MIQKKEFAPDPIVPYLAAKEMFRQFQILTACLREMTPYYSELLEVLIHFNVAEVHFSNALDEFEQALEVKE